MKGNNGFINVLTALATSGDTWVKLGTLLLIAISGIGNFLATEKSGADNRKQLEKEIHEIYAALNRNKEEFHQAVQDTAEIRKILERRTP